MSTADPQSFNRYTYCNDDPINHVDRSGLALSDIGVYQTYDPSEASPDWEAQKRKQARHETVTTTTSTVTSEVNGVTVSQKVVTRKTAFTGTFRDHKTKKLVHEVRIVIFETTTTDTIGGFPTSSTDTSVSAANTGNLRPVTDAQLRTMEEVAKDIVEVSRAKSFDIAISLGIALEESFLGAGAASSSLPRNAPGVNPMQIRSSSGVTPTLNRRENIGLAIDLFRHFNQSESRTIDGYAAGNPGANDRIREQIANVRQAAVSEWLVSERNF
jgi:hypothetical protein